MSLAPDRRRFLLTSLAGAVAAPFVAEAQPTARQARVGILTVGFPGALHPTIVEELRRLGRTEGHNIVFEVRHDEGKTERLDSLAAELVALKSDVIIVAGTPAAIAAKRATSSIPIVTTTVADPVGVGLVASWARPGGNVTGMAVAGPELAAKQLELLTQVVSKMTRVAVVIDPSNSAQIMQFDRELGLAGEKLGVQLHRVDVRVVGDLSAALTAFAAHRVEAVLVYPLRVFRTNAELRQLFDSAISQRLPTMVAFRTYVEAGALMAYFASTSDLFRRAAVYVDKILKGSRPSDLPVELPTKFELILNLKTAKALGLTIPPSLLLRADHVIE